jgi:hypothetical protein
MAKQGKPPVAPASEAAADGIRQFLAERAETFALKTARFVNCVEREEAPLPPIPRPETVTVTVED